MKTRLLIAAVACALLAACTAPVEPAQPETRRVVLHDGQGREVIFNAQIADDDDERETGLMFRESLDAGNGMLFIFDDPSMLNFWMKNTLIPLDIVYFDAERKFVSSTTMEPCVKEHCTTYPSGGPAQFALEIPAGTVAEKEIGPGWRLEMAPE